jgi:hypothetical protein
MAYSFFGPRTPTVPMQIDPWAVDQGDMYAPPDQNLPGTDPSYAPAPSLPPVDDQSIWPGYDENGAASGDKQATYDAATSGSGQTSGWNGVIPPEGPWLTNTTPPGGGTAAPATGVNAPVNGGPSIQQAYSSALQKILTGGNVQNPANSDAMVAYRAEAARGEARDRAFLAERAAATGGSASGGFETDLLGLRQNRRRGEASFRGMEQQRLQEAERQQLMQALALALSQGDNEAARALSQMLTTRGQDISRELGLGNIQLGQDNLGLGYARLQSDKDADALRYIFGN